VGTELTTVALHFGQYHCNIFTKVNVNVIQHTFVAIVDMCTVCYNN
jgi:hypothetical protein